MIDRWYGDRIECICLKGTRDGGDRDGGGNGLDGVCIIVYNLNVPRRSDRRQHGQTSSPPPLLSILQKLRIIAIRHVAHANRHLQIHGTPPIISEQKLPTNATGRQSLQPHPRLQRRRKGQPLGFLGIGHQVPGQGREEVHQ